MKNPFIENKAWSEGGRDDCYSVSFGQSQESASEIIKMTTELIESKYSERKSSQSSNDTCQGFSIPIGNDPLLPVWTMHLSFSDEETPLYGIYFAVFDLSTLLKTEELSIGRMIVVAQIKQGYSDERDDVKQGKKTAKYFKRKIGKKCVPWDDNRLLQDALLSEYDIQEAGKKLSTVSKVLLAMLGTAAAAALIKAIVDSGGEDELEEADAIIVNHLDEVEDLVLEKSPEVAIPVIFEPLHDGITRFSASQIGRIIGATGREVNLLLKEKGLIDGEPGNWRITEKGAPFAILRSDDNGGCSWNYLMWDESIIDELGNPIEHLEQINDIRALAGLPPLNSINPYSH